MKTILITLWQFIRDLTVFFAKGITLLIAFAFIRIYMLFEDDYQY